MPKLKIPRLVLSSVAGLFLAVLLAAETAGVALTKVSPETSVSVFPYNGLAIENVGLAQFSTELENGSSRESAARDVADIAEEATRQHLLTPKAIALLAIAESNPAKRRDILLAGSRVNRRNLMLQGLVMQEHLAAEDYPKLVETLDQILRVHPEMRRELFPVLASAMANESALAEFARILDGTSPWHQALLDFAVRQKDIVPNLAILRDELAIADEEFDRKLIAALGASGDLASAKHLWEKVSSASSGSNGYGAIDWNSQYPPFEWRLVDESGFRAQQSLDGSKLEISVRPGKGGIIAARILSGLNPPFHFEIDHSIRPSDQTRDVRLQLLCSEGDGQPFWELALDKADSSKAVEVIPGDCGEILLAINARAWSGRSSLGGTIDRIEIVEGS